MSWSFNRGLLAGLLGLLLLSGELGADLRFLGGSINNLQGGAIPLKIDANGDGIADLVMEADGDMGVSTLTPSANLHVAGNLRVDGALIFTEQSLAPATPAGNGVLYTLGGNLYFADTIIGTSEIGFQSTHWSTSGGNVYRITGNIGIGTDAPVAKLHIVGNLEISSQLIATAGSISAPGLSFLADPDTGLHLAAADNLSLVADAAEVMSLGSDLLVLRADLKSDRWLGTDENTFVGVEVAGAGALSHASGEEGWYNTGMGYQALYSLSTGYRNTAIGSRAGYALTTGDNNVAAGANAMDSATDASGCVVAGANAFSGQLIPDYTTGVGFGVRFAEGTGSGGTGFGYRCGVAGNSLSFGAEAAFSTTSGGNFVAVGARALYSNLSGTYNTAFGFEALFSATTANYQTAVGNQALYNSNADWSVALGSLAAYSQTSGEENTAVGRAALFHNQTGSRNTAIGTEAGFGAAGQSFSENTLLGYRAGYALTSGSNNLIPGCGREALSATAAGALDIGGLIQGDLGSGFVGIGTATPATNLHVNGNVYLSAGLIAGGNVFPASTLSFDLGSPLEVWENLYAVDCVVLSDRRLKEEIRPLRGSLAKTMRLRPVSFAWRSGDPAERKLGFIAQEVAEISAESVNIPADAKSPMELRYSSILSLLLGAHQEQQAPMQEVDSEVKALKARLEKLNARL
ncbi:MAG: tail fiber domain-containing protein, partial [Planctomycetes bacterium]|nr:tail fiber domain-containing protein [Planctomycetota bacterium]